MISTNQELAMFFTLFGLGITACFIPFFVVVIQESIKRSKSMKRCKERMRQISEGVD